MALSPGKGILSFRINTEAELYKSYMPFLRHGGVFIPTQKKYNLGDEVFLILTLLDESEKFPVATQVAWVTPPDSQGNQTAGIGLHFKEIEGENLIVKNKIETLLSGKLKSGEPCYTM